ncbi:glycoside hydrolase family 78 protein [Hypoxylon sp. CI-4A]|nr:glycoside hydrolase family 78 protein [Hypoxylon sp. CI-4A]
MKKWVDYLEARAGNNSSWRRWLFGLLLPSPAVATAYLANSARLLSEICGILDKKQEAEYYTKLSEKTRVAWRTAFVKEGGSHIAQDYQDDYVRALAFDLLEPRQRPAAVQRLVELVESVDFHLRAGFLSTGLLLPTLAENGRADIAGATTIWETWNGYDSKDNAVSSHNHYALGAVVRWLYEGVAGIRPTAPGYRHVRISPEKGGGLTYAGASIETTLGIVKSSWKLEDGRVELMVLIPPGATAVVVLGSSGSRTVESGSHSFKYQL